MQRQKRISFTESNFLEVALPLLFASMINKRFKTGAAMRIIRKVWKQIDGKKRFELIKVAARYSKKWSEVLGLLSAKMYEEEIPEFLGGLEIDEFLNLRKYLLAL